MTVGKNLRNLTTSHMRRPINLFHFGIKTETLKKISKILKSNIFPKRNCSRSVSMLLLNVCKKIFGYLNSVNLFGRFQSDLTIPY